MNSNLEWSDYRGIKVIPDAFMDDENRVIKSGDKVFVHPKMYKLINRHIKLNSTWYGRLYLKLILFAQKLKKRLMKLFY
jgi:hypothetical protein